VESWLSRARARLRGRLARRGLAPASGLLAALAPLAGAAQAGATARAALTAGRRAASGEAVALADEVVRALGRAKLKVAVAVLMVVTAGLAAWARPRAAPPVGPGASEAARQEEVRPVERAKAVGPARPRTIRWEIGGLNALALSPDGKVLCASARSEAKLWDAEALEERTRIVLVRTFNSLMPREHVAANRGIIRALAFSPDGKTVAWGGGLTVRLWDVKSDTEQAILRGHTVSLDAVAFSPDGKALASAGGANSFELNYHARLEDVPKELYTAKEVGELKVWDLATRKARAFYRGDTGRVMSVAFSPDGKTVAAGVRDGAIRLWDVASGEERLCLREQGPVGSVAFSPDGKTLVSTQGNVVHLWDLASRKVRARLRGHAGRVNAVAFAPDGTLATVGNVPGRGHHDQTGEARLWEAGTGRPRGAPLTFPHYGSSVAFGRRGTILAVGGTRGSQTNFGAGPGQITLWELAARQRPAGPAASPTGRGP
jgi:WD40 repeat protein